MQAWVCTADVCEPPPNLHQLAVAVTLGPCGHGQRSRERSAARVLCAHRLSDQSLQGASHYNPWFRFSKSPMRCLTRLAGINRIRRRQSLPALERHHLLFPIFVPVLLTARARKYAGYWPADRFNCFLKPDSHSRGDCPIINLFVVQQIIWHYHIYSELCSVRSANTLSLFRL